MVFERRKLEQISTTVLRRLIDQKNARVIVSPEKNSAGYWFGGGNLLPLSGGEYLLTGRYRNAGDSRTGLAAGERGKELVIDSSASPYGPFTREVSFTKADLSRAGQKVLSIEGSCLLYREGVYTLFVSSEKKRAYPPGIEDYQKPNTGVWSIDYIRSASLEGLKSGDIIPLLTSTTPNHLHVKDPFYTVLPGGRIFLGFCSHPFNWASSNSGFALLDPCGTVRRVRFNAFPRGSSWDAGMSRWTEILHLRDIPLKSLRGGREAGPALIFYDGGESVRNLDEHSQANSRPRGYSCEELGGAALTLDPGLRRTIRLSRERPLFVSPWGTGASRYLDVATTEEGLFATWEQSQRDCSQPLVGNLLTYEQLGELLEIR